MSDTNDLRLFEELRLHPWRAADKLKIDARLASLSVTDPKLASEYTAKYGAKLDAYLAANTKVEDLPALTPEEKQEVKEIVQELAKPKKVKKPSSHSSHVA